MTTELTSSRTKISDSSRPGLSPSFEKLYAFFAFWLITGAYYDAWTHTYTPELESFFTPAHGMLYTGGGLLVLLITYTAAKNMAIGYSFRNSLPIGFFPSIIGGVFFILGGVGDMIWHIIFGIENDLEAAFSATHLFLVVAFFLLMGGPMFAGMAKSGGRPTIRDDWQIMVSTMLVLSALTVITQWSHPLVTLQATETTTDVDTGHSLGILGIILQTVFMMGLILPLVKDRILPVGSVTFILTLNAFYLSAMSYAFVLVIPALLTGMVGDVIYASKGPFQNSQQAFRIFAVSIPAAYFGLYFLFLEIFMNLAWNAHIISGGIFFPSMVSLFLSYLVMTPTFSAQLEPQTT